MYTFVYIFLLIYASVLLLIRVIQTYRAQRGSMVSKSKLSNIKWTPIKVNYNCVFEDQMMLFYLKVNTNCIDVF